MSDSPPTHRPLRSRWLSNLGLAALIVISLLLAGLWVRSHTRGDYVEYYHRGVDGVDWMIGVHAIDGMLAGGYVKHVPPPPEASRETGFHHTTNASAGRWPGIKRVLGVEYWDVSAPTRQLRAVGVGIPLWGLMLLALIPWAAWWRRHARWCERRRRTENGLCLACGYDLRGSEALCPECGLARA